MLNMLEITSYIKENKPNGIRVMDMFVLACKVLRLIHTLEVYVPLTDVSVLVRY